MWRVWDSWWRSVVWGSRKSEKMEMGRLKEKAEKETWKNYGDPDSTLRG